MKKSELRQIIKEEIGFIFEDRSKKNRFLGTFGPSKDIFQRKIQNLPSFNEHQENLNISDVSDSYSVIGRWTEPDGTEEWDVIHNGPLTYDEALKIAAKAGRTWDESVPSDRKNLPHREIPIRFEKLQKMIEEERSK